MPGAAAALLVLAITATVSAACRGRDPARARDAGVHRDARAVTAEVVDAAPPIDAAEKPAVIATRIVASADTTCAILSDLTVRCWGANKHGQLGNGQTTDSPAPVAPKVRAVVDLQLADATACALLDDASVACWGRIAWNGRAEDTLRPTGVLGVTHVQKIFVFPGRACGRLTSGALVCWGNIDAGGHFSTLGANRVPTPVVGLDHVAGMTLDGAYADDGRLWRWSRDGVPRRVDTTGVAEIASRDGAVCARVDGGRVVCVDTGRCGPPPTPPGSVAAGKAAPGGKPAVTVAGKPGAPSGKPGAAGAGKPGTAVVGKPGTSAGAAGKPGTAVAGKPGTSAGAAGKPGTPVGKPGTSAGAAGKPGTPPGKPGAPAGKAAVAAGKPGTSAGAANKPGTPAGKPGAPAGKAAVAASKPGTSAGAAGKPGTPASKPGTPASKQAGAAAAAGKPAAAAPAAGNPAVATAPVPGGEPVLPLGVAPARQLAFGVGFCVVTTAGRLQCSDGCRKPDPLTLDRVEQVVDRCAILQSKAVVCFDGTKFAPIAGVRRATSLAIGRAHGCALDDGTITCWGDREHGQLGEYAVAP